MSQLNRTLQVMVDCQQDNTLVHNSNIQQHNSADDITSTDSQIQNDDDPLPIACLDDAVGIINRNWQKSNNP